MKAVFTLLLVANTLGAALRTVCASGCDHQTLSQAVSAHSPGDIIEMACGEDFLNSSITWPWKDNPRGLITTVRSSCWEKLPPRGVRVNPTQHRSLMPHLYPSNSSDAIIRMGGNQAVVTNVNTATNTITLDSSAGITNGAGIACRTVGSMPGSMVENREYIISSASGASFVPTENGSAVTLNTAGSGIYCTPTRVASYVRFLGINFEQRAGTPFLYSLLEIGTGYEAAVVGTPRNIHFDHCIFDSPVNESGPRNHIFLNGRYVTVEDSWLANAKQNSIESHAIVMVQTPGPVLIRNNYLNAASINILTGGEDTKIRGQIPTDITIVNNHFQKSGYMLWMQGTAAPTGSCLNGRYYIRKITQPNVLSITQTGTPGSTGYTYQVVAINGGAGSPKTKGYDAFTGTGNATLNSSNYNVVTWAAVTGASSYDVYRTFGGASQGKIASVSSGTLTYNDQGAAGDGVSPSDPTCADGGCYTCTASAWALDSSAPYRSETYNAKGFFESKKCLRCLLEGNWMDTSFADIDPGNTGYCFFLSSYHDDTNRYVTYRNNHCEKMWTGIGVAISYDGYPHSNYQIQIVNNNLLDMGINPDYTSNDPATPGNLFHRRSTYFGTAFDDVSVRNNTIRTAAGMTSTGAIVFSNFSGGANLNFDFRNNIIDQGGAGILYDTTGTDDCAPGSKMGAFIDTPTGRFRNNVLYGSAGISPSCAFTSLGTPSTVDFVSASDSTLQTISPYSPGCASGCAFVGTDGRAPGVNKALNDWHTSGAVAGTPRWMADFEVEVGSAKALLRYTAPTTAPCTVALYTNAGMTIEHADTDTSGKKLDSRSGSYTDGLRRNHVLGLNTALTPGGSTLYGMLTCASQTRPFEFVTKATGTGRTVPISYATSRNGQVCDDVAMSTNCTSFTGTAKHSVVMGFNSVRWYQEEGGRKRALIEP